MKRFFKLIFPCFIIFGLFCSSITAMATEEDNISDDQKGRLVFEKMVALGILDEDEGYESGVELTRGEFTRIVMKLCGDIVDIYSSEDAFLDVNPSLEDAKYILAAHALGYAAGDPDGNFYPGRTITQMEALKLTLCAVGYGGYVEINGGYPAGCVKTAADADLLDGLEVQRDKTVTWDYAMLLLENAIDVDVVKTTITYGGMKSEIARGHSILQERFSIYNTKSIIEANAYTDLMSTDSKLEEGTVLAGGIVYDTGDTNADECIGMNMEMYYFDDGETVPKLLYITPNENRSDVLELSPDDIDSLEGTQLHYCDVFGKNRYITLDKNATLIWNEKMTDLTPEKLQPEFGTVMLISNDEDSDYEVIRVMNYKPYVVTSASQLTKTISTRQGKNIVLNENEGIYFTIIKSDGIDVSFETIKSKQTVLYAESEPKGKMVKTVLVSSKTVSGKVDSVDASNNKISIDGYEYDITAELAKTIKLRHEGTFYLDAFDRIVYAEGVLDIVYGYLSCLYTEPSGDIMCEIFTENSNWVELPLKRKIKFNDETLTAENVYETLNTDNYRQLIRYLVNSDGEISKIETAKEIAMGSEEEPEAIKNDVFRLSASGKQNYRTTTSSFNGVVSVKDDAKIFIIPSEENGYDKAEISLKTPSDLEGDVSYSFEAYNANGVRTSPVFVVYDYSKAVIAEMLCVTDVGGEMESTDGEVYPSIVGYWKGQELIMPVNLRKDSPVQSINDVHRGDIISFSYNDNGQIDYIQKRSESLYSLSGGIYSMVTFASGTVTSFDTDEKKLVLQYDALGSSAVVSTVSLSDVYIYDMTSKEFSIGNINDLMVGDRLCARIRNLVLMEMFVIRD